MPGTAPGPPTSPANRAWYERQKRLFANGEITSLPPKPNDTLELPAVGAPLLPVTFSAITAATGLVAIDPSQPDQLPFLALELGHQALELDREIKKLEALNLPEALAKAKADLSPLNNPGRREGALDSAVRLVADLAEKLDLLRQYKAQRTEITGYFVNTDLGKIPVPILKNTGEVTREVGVGGMGLEDAMKAAAASTWTTRNHALGDTFQPVDIFISGKPIYFFTKTSLATLRNIFFALGSRTVSNAGREAIELVTQEGIPAAARTLVRNAASKTVSQVRQAINVVPRLTKLADDLRSVVRSQGGELARRFRRGGGNIATSELQIGDDVARVHAFSGTENLAGFAPYVKNSDRVLGAGGAGQGVVNFLRDVDAEAKILEKMLELTTPETRGTLRLFSERPFCESCETVITNFHKYRPSLTLELFAKNADPVIIPPRLP